jgi:uroporphyrinogen decarboxylase
VKRRHVHIPTPYGEEKYSEVDVSPLCEAESIDDVEAYLWPNADHFDYTMVKRQCRAILDKGRVVVFMGDRLNRISQLKPAMYLRGIERILADFALEPDIASAIIRKIRDFYEGYLDRILDAADGLVDIVLSGDDFGQQNGSLLSPIMWDKYLSEGFARYMDIAHSYGAATMHHTCGDVRGLVGRMNDLGLDILQSLQPEAMADWFGEMKSTYGDDLCFHGGISIQQTLPRGKPADVIEEVAERVAQLGVSGGYILCTAHNIQADCPPENVLAMIDAFRVHGSYPLS